MRLRPWRESKGDGGRGSGRTYRQIESLREGDVYLVHAPGMRYTVEEIAKKVGLRGKLKIYVWGTDEAQVLERLRGLRGDQWIEIDHWSYPSYQPLVEFIKQHNDKVIAWPNVPLS